MKSRPETLESITVKIPTGYGNLYVTISEYNNKPFEIFCTLGKSGKSTMAKAEAIGRMVSLALRHEVDLEEIINQPIDIDGGSPIAWKDTVIKSIPDAVAKILKERYLERRKS